MSRKVVRPTLIIHWQQIIMPILCTASVIYTQMRLTSNCRGCIHGTQTSTVKVDSHLIQYVGALHCGTARHRVAPHPMWMNLNSAAQELYWTATCVSKAVIKLNRSALGELFVQHGSTCFTHRFTGSGKAIGLDCVCVRTIIFEPWKHITRADIYILWISRLQRVAPRVRYT